MATELALQKQFDQKLKLKYKLNEENKKEDVKPNADADFWW